MKFKFVRNLNKRRGKAFYVIYSIGRGTLDMQWLGRVELSKDKKKFVLATEEKVEFDAKDLIKIATFIANKKKKLGVDFE